MSLEEFRQKFEVDSLAIVATRHWTWSVRPAQTTLGCGVLSLNRLCRTFGEITAGEGEDLAGMARELEARLRRGFENDKVNYQMLMMRDPHVHMHVFPRYETPREFAGRTWVDETWPRPPASAWNPEDFGTKVLVAIRDHLAEV